MAGDQYRTVAGTGSRTMAKRRLTGEDKLEKRTDETSYINLEARATVADGVGGGGARTGWREARTIVDGRGWRAVMPGHI